MRRESKPPPPCLLLVRRLELDLRARDAGAGDARLQGLAFAEHLLRRPRELDLERLRRSGGEAEGRLADHEVLGLAALFDLGLERQRPFAGPTGAGELEAR